MYIYLTRFILSPTTTLKAMKNVTLLLLLSLLFTPFTGLSHLPPAQQKKSLRPAAAQLRADCERGTASVDLAINNVRASLQVAGDLWWDGQHGRYIVPKIEPGSGYEEVSALLVGGVWLGGVDPGGNLKIACQTYGRFSGQTDFFPGPIGQYGQTDPETCEQWDKMFKVSGDSVRLHLDRFYQAAKEQQAYDPALIPEDVKAWPARGNPYFRDIYGFNLPFETQGLAPFWDKDGDGLYEPVEGDYPIAEVRGCDLPRFGDEMVFWIYNDAGGVHTQSGGDALQMEIQVTSFAFNNLYELHNTTFYTYKLINRSIESIDSTFFAFWADPDLGCYTDDYVGCDPERSLAYVYNADDLDGENTCDDCPQGINTYCTDIPMLGIDFFRGPLNEYGEELGMSSFTYYNNGGLGPIPGTDDPHTVQEYYNYLSGSWKDGTRFTYGGSGYNLGSIDVVNYAFPEPPADPDGWSMCTESLPQTDPRTIQASGPFRLDPGAVNQVAVSVIWVPDLEYPCPDIAPLLEADFYAQKLFDNCFYITDALDAPDVDWVELDRKVVAVLSNAEDYSSNNSFEDYRGVDLCAPEIYPLEDRFYNFEGYKLYQLANERVDFRDLNDPDKARLVFQCDIKNDIGKIYNWVASPFPNSNPFQSQVLWSPELMVDGADEGIRHTIPLTTDAFATGSDSLLINHRKYYYTAVAYAYNNYKDFEDLDSGRFTGQRKQYDESRRNVRTYSVIPRPMVYDLLNTEVGEEPVITRLAGQGNGGQKLEISDEMRDQIFAGSNNGSIQYLPGSSPIQVQVYNPLEVDDARFELTLIDDDLSNDSLETPAFWQLTRLNDGEIIAAERSIDQLNEQLIAEHGFSVTVHQQLEPGHPNDRNNGVQGNILVHRDEEAWLVPLVDPQPPLPNPLLPTNWDFYDFIKNDHVHNFDLELDPFQQFTQTNSAGFYPYGLLDFRLHNQPYITPAWLHNFNNIVRAHKPLSRLNNVDIILTPDKSKWSRCVVVETANPYYYSANGLGLTTEGGAENFDLRRAASVSRLDADGNGLPDPDGSGEGMSWFPGYAVDVETGERLNVFFGENSTYNGVIAPEFYHSPAIAGKQLGNDMMWNPSDQLWLRTDGAQANIYDAIGGGQHYIYVTRQAYDRCAQLQGQLQDSLVLRALALNVVTWSALPLLRSDIQLLSYEDGLIPSEVLIKLRANSAYEIAVGTGTNNGYPTYQFEFNGKAPAPGRGIDRESDPLSDVNIFPNPYYGSLAYSEADQLPVVRITNLPAKCTVTIYSLDGKFIRQFNRNEQPVLQADRPHAGIVMTQIGPDLDWDLNNFDGVKVASGAYLIHVAAPGFGERVLKWFGKIN